MYSEIKNVQGKCLNSYSQQFTSEQVLRITRETLQKGFEILGFISLTISGASFNTENEKTSRFIYKTESGRRKVNHGRSSAVSRSQNVCFGFSKQQT